MTNVVDEAENEGRLIRRWTHDGVECAMVRSPMHGVNGYVRVPDGVELPVDEDGDVALDAPGGITWGPDGGWIGFDTSRGWDMWWDPDVPESRLERTSRELGLPLPPLAPAPWMNVWTLEKVEAAVNELAAAVRARVR